MFTSPGPVAFSIFGIAVHWYGILISMGVLAALFYGAQELKRRGFKPDALYEMGFWVVISGVIGSRLYYVIFQWDFYSKNPLEIFAVWKGGLAVHGALIFGFLAFLIYAKLKKIAWLFYADVISPGVLLAQALGRWGNFFNNEAFGKPTDLPWKLYIPESFRPAGYGEFEYFHPTFLYESLWNLIGFVLLVILTRKFYKKGGEKPEGLIFFSYLIYYSFGRFFIESLRMDSLYIGPLRTAQAISVCLFLTGLTALLFLCKKFRRPSRSEET